MLITELESGEYYHILSETGYLYIMKCLDKNIYEYHICPKDKIFYKNPNRTSNFIKEITWEIRLASKEEIDWLELCNKNNKYIERPKIMNYGIY